MSDKDEDVNEIELKSSGIRLKGESADSFIEPLKTLSKTATSLLIALDNIVGIPVDALNFHLNRFRAKFEELYSEIPEKERENPSVRIGSLVLREVLFCMEDDDLQEMFAQLLASSTDKRIKHEVEPSFATILSQLSSDDAARLEYLWKPRKIEMSNPDFFIVHYNFGNLMRLGIVQKPLKPLLEKMDDAAKILHEVTSTKKQQNRLGSSSLKYPWESYLANTLLSISKELNEEEVDDENVSVELTSFGKRFASCVIGN